MSTPAIAMAHKSARYADNVWTCVYLLLFEGYVDSVCFEHGVLYVHSTEIIWLS